MTDTSSEQNIQVQDAASAAGAEWASAVRDALEAEGRRPVGLWPGTLTEARTRAVRLIHVMKLAPASGEQREVITRTLYDAARTSWLGWREREE